VSASILIRVADDIAVCESKGGDACNALPNDERVDIHLLTMVTIQQRRERMNRQINERLRTLIAAYKTLGASFTGDLTVDPAHLRDLRRHAEVPGSASTAQLDLSAADSSRSDRARRVRDAVEATLPDRHEPLA
jgi:hypothetical protein